MDPVNDPAHAEQLASIIESLENAGITRHGEPWTMETAEAYWREAEKMATLEPELAKVLADHFKSLEVTSSSPD